MGRTTGASSRTSSTPTRTRGPRRRAAAAPARPRGPLFAPRHHLALPGAATVPVPVLKNLSRGLEQTVDQQAIMCLYGDAGVGKTFALNTVLASGAVPARRARVVPLLPRPAPTPAALRAHLADAVNVGHVRPEDPSAFDAALRTVLAGRAHLFVVDEAQRLDAACFEYLRYLFDDPHARFSLILCAGEHGLALLRRRKMLASRTAVWLKVPALTPDEVRWAVPRFHPLWQTSDPKAVDLLDTRLCHGNFRRWAQATHHTLSLTRSSGGHADHRLLEELLDDRLLPHQDTPRPSVPPAAARTPA